jgi:hypothetical protein
MLCSQNKQKMCNLPAAPVWAHPDCQVPVGVGARKPGVTAPERPGVPGFKPGPMNVLYGIYMGYIWEMCGKCAGYVWYVIRHLRCNWDTLCEICYRKLRMLMFDLLDKLYHAVQELVTSFSESTALSEKSGTSHGSS